MEDDRDESDSENAFISETNPVSSAENKQARLNLHHICLCNLDQK